MTLYTILFYGMADAFAFGIIVAQWAHKRREDALVNNWYRREW